MTHHLDCPIARQDPRLDLTDVFRGDRLTTSAIPYRTGAARQSLPGRPARSRRARPAQRRRLARQPNPLWAYRPVPTSDTARILGISSEAAEGHGETPTRGLLGVTCRRG